MSEWYEIEHDKRNDEQKEACRIAYYRSLLATPYGRQVYADMRRRVRELDEITVKDTDFSAAVLMLDDFMRETKSLCGIVDEMAVIEAEQKIAAGFKVEKAEPDNLSGFRE